MEKVLGEQKSSWLATDATTTTSKKKTEDALFFRVSSPSQLRRSGTLQHSNVKEIASLDVFRKKTLLGVLDMRPRNF